MIEWLKIAPGWLACVVLIYDKLASWRGWVPYDLCIHWERKKKCGTCKDEPRWKGDRWV